MDAEGHQAFFATTRWSVVLSAGAPDSPAARDALAKLCERSWYPLYAFLRRRGHASEESKDLTQGFFADLLERGDIARACPERGRFRSFLLTALKNYVANQKLRARAQKRGAGVQPQGFEWSQAEQRFSMEPEDRRTPETLFAAHWARELLASVMELLESEYKQRDKQALFELLAPCLGGTAEGLPYAEIARSLEASEGSVKVAVHRMRARFRQILHAEIRQTLPEGADLELEIRDLFEALGNPG